MKSIVKVLCLGALLPGLVSADDWTRFRGPNGAGRAGAIDVPLEWTAEDFQWKAKLPGVGHSSPVTWEDRVFVTCADESTALRRVAAVDFQSGRILWTREFPSETYRHHRDNSFAAASPAVDAYGVYVTWSTPEEITLRGLSHDGKDLWRRSLGPLECRYGSGVSPMTHEGLVVLPSFQRSGSFLLAVDSKTGETRWKVPRQGSPVSYATPCVRRRPDGGEELIFLGTVDAVTAVDPRTGKVTWELDGLADNVERERPVASPVLAGNLVVGSFAMSGMGTQVYCVQPGSADAEPRRVLRLEKVMPYVPTPLVRDDLLFLLQDGGRMGCHRLPSGELLWRERIRAGFYSSPILVGKHIYIVSKEGTVFVLAAGEKFEQLARCELGERSFATPAVKDGSLLFRTHGHLMRLSPRRQSSGDSAREDGAREDRLRENR